MAFQSMAWKGMFSKPMVYGVFLISSCKTAYSTQKYELYIPAGILRTKTRTGLNV